MHDEHEVPTTGLGHLYHMQAEVEVDDIIPPLTSTCEALELMAVVTERVHDLEQQVQRIEVVVEVDEPQGLR